MQQKFSLKFSKLDDKIKKIMINGLIFSIFLGIIAIFFLITYQSNPNSIEIYKVGLSLLETSFLFTIAFVLGGFASNEIKNQLQ